MVSRERVQTRTLFQPEAGLICRRHLVPGRQVEITAAGDNRVTTGTILQVDVGRWLVLGFIKKRLPHDTMEISFVIRIQALTGQEARRYGFRTPILERAAEYEYSSGIHGPAVIVEYPEELKATTVRHYYRVPVPTEAGLSVRIEGSDFPVELVDLSLGGCKVWWAEGLEAVVGQEFGLQFMLDQARETKWLSVKAKVAYLFSARGGRRGGQIGLRFKQVEEVDGTWLEKVVGLLIQNQQDRPELAIDNRPEF